MKSSLINANIPTCESKLKAETIIVTLCAWHVATAMCPVLRGNMMCASVDVCVTQFVLGSSQNSIQNSKLGKVNWALPQVSFIDWITDACPQ